jgi:fumarate hydratase subunit alpha
MGGYMREIHINEIINTIEQLCIDANCNINDDLYNCISNSIDKETSEVGKEILTQLIENSQIAKQKQMPICQDTGIAVIFCNIGQDVRVVGGNLTKAINEGVRLGYQKGYLRKSVVSDPFFRENTKDNTPAIIHYNIIEGNKLEIEIAPKGFGSENMSKIHMLKPADGIEGAKQVIIDTVDKAGANACPPMVVGVGIGGTFEKAAIMAKKALLRPLGEKSTKEHIKQLEEELLMKINKLGIGPQGLGGNITALAVNVETYPTHIAGLPVAINISCHVTRHAKAII